MATVHRRPTVYIQSVDGSDEPQTLPEIDRNNPPSFGMDFNIKKLIEDHAPPRMDELRREIAQVEKKRHLLSQEYGMLRRLMEAIKCERD